jgi:ATP-dependent RNA helicase RhlE
MSELNKNGGFRAFNLPAQLQAALDRANFTEPTPIQESAIPVALTGRDVIGIAQTGTGKTLAFALPILTQILRGSGRALILAPTRELAIQIDATFRKVGESMGIRTAVLIGGAPINRQVQQLKNNPQVVVATPGRLIDHIQNRKIHMDRTSIVVLDEADRMFDMGFAPAVRQIMEKVPAERQTLLFSATMPKEVVQLANSYLRDPLRIEVSPAGEASELVRQELYVVPHIEKGNLLNQLLYDNKGTILVFARTRHGARKVAKFVREAGHTAAEIHSDRTLSQRQDALEGFKRGRYRVLVATDIASRGIDVKDISLVINYDLPDQAEDYIHRIGRTGRAGKEGVAITMATPQQSKELRAIEKLLGSPIARSAGSAALEVSSAPVRARTQTARPNVSPRRPGAAPSRKPFGPGKGRSPAAARSRR